MTHQTEPLALLRDTEHYLSALHGSVARHDNLAANYGCAGCELRDRIAAAVSAAVAPPTNQAALRDRIAQAIEDAFQDYSAEGHGLPASDMADAVLAVLPEVAYRDAVLREAADRIDNEELPHDYVDMFDNGARWAARLLRRMADETATEHRPAVSRWRVETLDNLANEWAPGTGWPVRALAVERFDAMNAQAPRWKDGTPVTRRLVRETTTYTVEAETGPAAGARQDEPAPGSTQPRPCRAFVSGSAVWCCEEGEADCPCVCHQPPAGARQDGAES
ncbi:hypothetical protein [Streptomyces albogriseolus]|uniref:hypothetical protein n=1 Tax=Streptomyces albogriseolus TaxID=1887 RepID=UPI003F49E71C